MYFRYDEKDTQAETYTLLQSLMERWEYEIVEFKEATGQYSTEKIGQYFSAISNEANLKENQWGWLILGVSEADHKHVVGTSFKRGDPQLLEKFKYEVSQNTTDGISFLEIIELYPEDEHGNKKRVLLFKIPAAAVGIPTAWKNQYYARTGESLTHLQQYKIDMIRGQERRDWTKRVAANVGIQALDSVAIAEARMKYKEKMNRPHIIEEVDAMTDEEFLAKLHLVENGHVTYAALILLGKEEYTGLFETPPQIMWRLYDRDGLVKDYQLFTVPFLLVIDQVLEKIRFLTYRYLPNRKSLTTREVMQYDSWVLRELLSNCIAHANYQMNGRIYINEFEDYLTISNPGTFIPQNIRAILKPGYNPPYYRNPLLAQGMSNFRMIDTATSGIKKIFRIMKERCFPLPDYETFQHYQVVVTVYGKTLNDRYTHILYDRPDLTIETVFLLDQIQKGKQLPEVDIAYMREEQLLRGEEGNYAFIEDENEMVIDDTYHTYNLDRPTGDSLEEARKKHDDGSEEVRKKFSDGSEEVRKKFSDGSEGQSVEIKLKINKTQRKLLDYLSRDPRMTGAILAQIIGISQRSIEKNLKILKDMNLLYRHGATKGGYWEVRYNPIDE